MKKIIASIAALLLALNVSQAQSVTLTCENSASSQSTTNNRNYDIANCWVFGGVSYQSTNVLNGV
ncbi:MAG: hypothetical protein SGJ00_11600 [bacterium]|nr:hypothetical protein [bacterium]